MLGVEASFIIRTVWHVVCGANSARMCRYDVDSCRIPLRRCAARYSRNRRRGIAAFAVTCHGASRRMS